MTFKNVKNIAIFSIVALIAVTSYGLSEAIAEESTGYKMVGDVQPVLTFTFREGVETYHFPVFEMGENLVDDSGVSFSVEGSITHAPLLHKAMDEAYKYRLSNAAFDYQFKYFDVDADFVKNGESVTTLDYNNCRINNYQVETLDSNDYESYSKEVGFAIVDKIDFVCSGVNMGNDAKITSNNRSLVDYGESGFVFANDMRTSVTFDFKDGMEKIEFPVFNLVSGFAESGSVVVAEFEVEGVLGNYPLLQKAIDNSRKVSGLGTASNPDFDALVEFTNGESVIRGLDFIDCRVSDAKITTQTDKEEGFTGKSGFVVVNQIGFTCAGIDPINTNYDKLKGDLPIWKTDYLYNEYVEPIQNTDKGLSTFTTITYPNGVETIEFSMFKQSNVLTVTESTGDFLRKATYPTIELRGIVGDYPMLYNLADKNLEIRSVTGTQLRNLVDIDIDIVTDSGEVIRGFNYQNCRITDYDISTAPNSEESYVKNKFALENIFDFECQGYSPNNPIYDAMFNTEKANTESSKDLRNTQKWAPGFFVE